MGGLTGAGVGKLGGALLTGATSGVQMLLGSNAKDEAKAELNEPFFDAWAHDHALEQQRLAHEKARAAASNTPWYEIFTPREGNDEYQNEPGSSSSGHARPPKSPKPLPRKTGLLPEKQSSNVEKAFNIAKRGEEIYHKGKTAIGVARAIGSTASKFGLF